MKVLVCGDRNWTDFQAIHDRLERLPAGSTVISGAARGADSLAAEAAAVIGHWVEEFPADWRRYGPGAGPIRNRQMLDQEPDLVIAFHADLAASRGTADTVKEAKRRGIPVEVVTGYEI